MPRCDGAPARLRAVRRDEEAERRRQHFWCGSSSADQARPRCRSCGRRARTRAEQRAEGVDDLGDERRRSGVRRLRRARAAARRLVNMELDRVGIARRPRLDAAAAPPACGRQTRRRGIVARERAGERLRHRAPSEGGCVRCVPPVAVCRGASGLACMDAHVAVGKEKRLLLSRGRPADRAPPYKLGGRIPVPRRYESRVASSPALCRDPLVAAMGKTCTPPTGQ